ncbi:MAG: heavy-metal-associated domain-containing protein [Saprospiraceae bacterium]|nr:heavy-metal-associated domain-containing protein [Saprospiraceae bacterium]MBP7699098.1 heavy-metal-associated domain-containing protein [Saprospiraceae bacterium]
MKNILIVFSLITFFCANSALAQTMQTATFKVWGNCGMCEKKIERAAKIKGVSKADWDVDTHIMTVIYNSEKANLDDIQKKIAGVGYDTEKFRAPEKVYEKLHHCCQYERKPN